MTTEHLGNFFLLQNMTNQSPFSHVVDQESSFSVLWESRKETHDMVVWTYMRAYESGYVRGRMKERWRKSFKL